MSQYESTKGNIHTLKQTEKILKAYLSQPSELLQQQLIDLHFDLIQAAIRESLLSFEIGDFEIGGIETGADNNSHPSKDSLVSKDSQTWQNRPTYLSLLATGAEGLVQSLGAFDPNSNLSFRHFADDNLRSYMQAWLGSRLTTSLKNLNKANLQDSNSQNPKQEDSKSVGKTPARKAHQSFRLSGEETKYLQQVVSNPEKRVEAGESEPSDLLKEKTWQLLQQYRQSPSTQLRNHLVQLNMGLARKEAYHWINQCNEPFEDLLQVGVMGLIRAIERFDVERRNAFSSFAVPYIRGEIQHYLRDKSNTVRIPRHWIAIYNQACKVIPQLRADLQREPTGLEVARSLNIPISEWQEVRLACQNRTLISLDASVHEEDEGSTALGDMMPDQKYRSFQLAQEDSMRLYQELSHLEERTRQIIEFVFIKEFTHREVAEILGISAVTVSRQVKKGLATLKQVMNTPLER